MQTNVYFENLNFNTGKKINVSTKINRQYFNTAHWHPFIEILLSLKDDNKVTLNYTTYNLKINDLLIIYPGDLHSLINPQEDSYIVVQFPKDLLIIISDFNNNYSTFSQYHHIPYTPVGLVADRFIYHIKKIAELYYSDQLFSEAYLYSQLLKFFVEVGEFCENLKKEDFSGAPHLGNQTTRLMTEACLYISQNCVQPLTLDDISKHTGISSSHFSRLFKNYTNMTFIDFLTKERIKHAEFLMANPLAHITDIAFDSGFSSISTFNRAFKKIKGISPTEFRKTLAME